MSMKANRYIYLLLLPCVCFCVRLSAQATCSGSALAPVFKQTFGTSALSTSKNVVPSGFITNYAFNGSGNLADGQYMVTPLVQNAGKNDWAVGGDHTGDVNGNMFLVNAGTGASLFFKQQVDNLCPGSTFSFSAWLANMNTASLTAPICSGTLVYPNVTFHIKDVNGNTLASFNTGNVPLTSSVNVAPNWKQYGFQFALPAGITSLVLEMVDFYGGLPQCGNDLAIDDIMFSACTPQASISFNTPTAVCAGSNVTVKASLLNSPFVSPAYKWQQSISGGLLWFDVGTPSTADSLVMSNVTFMNGGMYRVIVGPDIASLSSSTCTAASNALQLTVYSLPVISMTSNNPVCTGSALNLSADITSGLAPYQYSWVGPGFSSTNDQPSIANVTIAANAGSYVLTVTDANGCVSAASDVVVVTPKPSVAVAGGDQAVCNVTTVTLDADAVTSGAGTWTEVSGPNTALIADPLQRNTAVQNMVAGVYKFRWSVTLGPCAASTDDVLITIAPATVGGTLSGGTTVCATANNGALTLTGNTGAVLQWESSIDNGTTWNIVANTSGSLSYTNLATTTSYRAQVQSGNCATAYSTVATITVSQATVAGVLSGGVNVCASANTGTLTVSGSTGSIVRWETSTDNGNTWNTVSNTTNTLSFTNLQQTMVYRALVKNNPCTQQYTNTVTVTVYQAVAAGTATGNAVVCASANTGMITLTGTTGTIQQWETSSDNGNTWSMLSNTNASTAYHDLTATTLFRALVVNGNCASQYSNNVTVAADAATVAGTVTGNATVCALANNGMVTLTGYTGSIVNWESSTDNGNTWSTISGTASSYGYNNLATGTMFKANVKNGVCAAQYSVQAMIATSPVTNGGTLAGAATVCGSANSGTILLSGYTGSIIQWETSADNGSTWNVLANTTDHFSYNNLTATTIYRMLVQSGSCNPAYSTMATIAVDAPTVAGVLSGDANVCASSNSGTVSLAGNTGNTIHWEASTDNGSTWNIIANTTNTSSYNNLAATTIYRALIQSGVCASQYTNNVTITIDAPTVAGTLSGNAVLCATANSGVISLAGNTGNITHWESSTDNGNTWNTITNTTNTFSYNNLNTTTIYKVLVQSGVCNTSHSNNVTIAIDQPTIPGVLSGDATLCASANSGTITLTGNTGNIIHWESSTDNGNSWNAIANTSNALSYNNLTATTIYRALIQSGVCASQYTNNVTITIDAPTIAGTLSGNAVLCATANSGVISLTGNTGNITHWESSIDNGNTWNVIANTTNTLSYNNLTATTIYKTLIQSGVCSALLSNNVTIAIDQPTLPGILSGDATLCASANSGTISLTGNTGNIIHWESSTDNGNSWNAIANTSNALSYNNLTVTTIYRALIQSGVCASQYSNNVTITIDAPTIAGTLSGNAVLCATANSGVISLTGNTGNVTHWESSTDNGNTWNTITNTTNTFSYNNLNTTTIYKVLVQSGVCNTSHSNNVTIAIDQPTIPGVLSGDATLCASANSGTITLTGNTGNIIHWESSTDNGNSWNAIANTSNALSYNNLTATTIYRALIQSGVCASQYTNNVTITIDAPTIAGTLSGNAVLCATANSGVISLTGNTGNITHWESSIDNGNTWNVIANTTNTLSYNNLTATTIYKTLIQSGVCSALLSNNVTIAIDQPTLPGILSGDATLCASANSGTISLTGNTGNIIHWESSTDNGNSWNVIANTSNTLSYNNLTATTTYRTLVQSGVCASQYANNVTIIIDAPTIAGTLSGNTVLCATANSGVISLTGNTGNITHWESSTDNGNTWNVIANTTNTLSYNNLTTTTIYKTLIQSGVCSALLSNNVTIAIDQPTIPGILSGDATLCASANSGTITLTGNTGNIIHWESSTDNGNSWNVIANTSNTLSYNNLTATTTYRTLVQSGVCASQYANNVTITIDAPTVAGTLSGNAVLCATANSGVISLTGNTGNVTHWESSIDNGNTWNVIANTTNTLSYNNLNTTTLYKTLIQSGVCNALFSNNVTIAIDQPTIAGVLSGDATLCASANSGTITLTGNTGNIIHWESSTDNENSWNVIANTSSALSYNNLTATTIYRALIQNGVCASQYANNVTITIDAPTVAGTLSVNVVLCATANSGVISLAGNTGNITHWESSTDNGNTWNTITNTTNTLSYNNLNTTTIYKALVRSGVCNALLSNNVTIAIDQPTIPGVLSGDATLCASANSGTITLTGNTGNIIHWESSTDNGNSWNAIANTSNALSYNNLTVTTIYRALIQSGVCASQYSNNVTITIDAPTIAGTLSGNAVLCATANSGNISLIGQVGSTLYWKYSTDNGTTWNNIANTTNTLSYNNLATTTIYKVAVQSGSCAGLFSNDVTIAIDQPTIPGILSGDATLCASANSGTITLTGNTGNIIHWESSTDNGNSWNAIANTSSALSYNNLTATTIYRALIQNGVCASQYANNVTITIDAPTIAGTLSGNAVLCATANSGVISLTGNTGNVTHWESSIDNGNTWNVIANTTNTLSYNNLTTTTIYKTLIQSGVCNALLSNNVAVAIDQPTIPGILSDDATLCASANSGTISLTGNTGNIIHWESSADNGNSWNVIANTSSALSYNNLTATTIYRALIQNGVCASQYANNVTITIDAPTIAGTLSGNAVLCATANNGIISLNGSAGNITHWESSTDNGNTWSVIANTTNTLSYNNLTTTTIYKTLIQSGVCSALLSNNVTIAIDQPTIPGVLSGDATLCASANSGTISLTGNTGNIIHWESSTDNGNTWNVIANTSNTLSYNNLTVASIYRALIQSGVCASQYSNNVIITIDQPAVSGSLSGNAAVCSGLNSGSVLLSGFSGSLLWESSTDNGTNWTALNHTQPSLSYTNIPTTTQFRVLIRNGVCATLYSNIATISVSPQVTIATAGADQFLCNATVIQLAGNSPIAGNGRWTLLSGPSPVLFSNPATGNPTVTGITPGAYYFEWRISNNVCADSKDTVTVVVYSPLSNSVDTTSQLICSGQPVTINAQPASGGNNFYQYQWEKSYDGAAWSNIANANAVSYSFTPDTSVLIRRNIVSQVCLSTGNTVRINVLRPVTNNQVAGNQQVCEGTVAKNITGTLPNGGDGVYFYQWQQSGDNGATWSAINGATSRDLPLQSSLATSVWLRRVVTTQTCYGPQASISNTISLDVRPVASAAIQYNGGVYCKLNTGIEFTTQATHTDSIKWNFGDGTILTTTARNISHVYTKAGIFTPSAQFSNASGCNVMVAPKDTIRIDELKAAFELAATNDCGKTTYRFVDTSASFFPVGKRIWAINQNVRGNDRTMQYAFNANGTNEASLQVNTIYGCSASLQAKFDVNIYSYPKVDISAVSEACLNNLMELKSIVTSTDSVRTRLWNLSNGMSATDSVMQVAFYSEGKYVVKLTVATVNSCYDSALKQISIHPTPKVAVNAVNLVCKGGTLELKASGAAGYIWKDQNGNIICNNCSTLNITPQKNTEYKVVGYSEYGCSEIASAGVRVIEPFKLTAKTSDTLCIGESKKITVGGATSYSWRNDVGLNSYNTPAVLASPAVTTTYRVTGKDEFNCFADTADIKLTVGKPTAFTIGRDTSILSGVPVQLHANSSLPDIRSWQWKGNATFSCLSCVAPTAKVIMDECLSCTATNIYGCKTSDTICITTFCPGSEVFIPNAFSPDGDGINDVLFVQGRGIKIIKSFRIFSRWGELVFEKSNFSPGDKASGWDGRIRGKMASPDVFVYVCEAICEKGTPAIFKGNTAVLK
jgi:gliding motility-associated-like protein